MAGAIILKKLKGMKSFGELYDYLKTHPDETKLLGSTASCQVGEPLSYFH